MYSRPFTSYATGAAVAPPAPGMVMALNVHNMFPVAASTAWNKPLDSPKNATSPATTKPESAGCGVVICQTIFPVVVSTAPYFPNTCCPGGTSVTEPQPGRVPPEVLV